MKTLQKIPGLHYLTIGLLMAIGSLSCGGQSSVIGASVDYYYVNTSGFDVTVEHFEDGGTNDIAPQFVANLDTVRFTGVGDLETTGPVKREDFLRIVLWESVSDSVVFTFSDGKTTFMKAPNGDHIDIFVPANYSFNALNTREAQMFFNIRDFIYLRAE